jgi:hypothetical protein
MSFLPGDAIRFKGPRPEWMDFGPLAVIEVGSGPSGFVRIRYPNGVPSFIDESLIELVQEH